MKYLIILDDSAPFFSDHLNPENFEGLLNYTVINIADGSFTNDLLTWFEIEYDTL